MASISQGNNEALQLPTPETMADQQSESSFSDSSFSLVSDGLVGAAFQSNLPGLCPDAHTGLLWVAKGLTPYTAPVVSAVFPTF